ncbi:MAG: sensor histidine kinase [Bacteroidota bacterium]
MMHFIKKLVGIFHIDKVYSSWTGERLIRHILYWCAWLFFYASINGAYSEFSFLVWLKVEFCLVPIKLPYVYFILYYLVPRYLIRKKYMAFFSIAFVVTVISGIALQAVYVFYIYEILNQQVWAFFNWKMCFKTLDLIYIASLPTLLKLFQRYLQQDKINQQLSAQKLGAELQILKNQLHPHFLFNTLNNLYGMVLTTNPKAPDVVIGLSNMMSYMLYECEGDFISLKKEVDNLKNYIELEKIRYGDRLDISFEVEGQIENKVIAPLLLISFIENAFKHGPAKNEANSWVRINLWITDKELSFKIENSKAKQPPEDSNTIATKSGIGLNNTRKRLALIYPGQHELSIDNDQTFLVHLKIKW